MVHFTHGSNEEEALTNYNRPAKNASVASRKNAICISNSMHLVTASSRKVSSKTQYLLTIILYKSVCDDYHMKLLPCKASDVVGNCKSMRSDCI